jgi:hypothetical protein
MAQYGVQVLFENDAFYSQSGGDNISAMKAHIDAAAGLGADVVRISASWHNLEPGARGQYSQYELKAMTETVAYAKALGLKVVMGIAQSPYWATNGAAPRGSAEALWDAPTGTEVDAFAAALVKLNRSLAAAGVNDAVTGWEIWNEPNTTTYWKGAALRAGTDVQVSLTATADYVKLLNASYAALKAVDPKAVVLGGSIAGGDIAYIKKMYDLGAKFDGLAIHPYPKANPFNKGHTYDVDQTDARDPLSYDWSFKHAILTARAEMVARGDSAKKLWLTEFGWSSTSDWGGAGSAALQGQYMKDALAMIPAWDFVHSAIAYRSYDEGTDTFGLMTSTGAWKSAATELRKFITAQHSKYYELLIKGLDVDWTQNIASFRHAWAAVNADLEVINKAIEGKEGRVITDLKHLVGSSYNDSLAGDATASRVMGQLGNDTLRGRAGNDNLDGGAGNDVIVGGAGADILYGGVGADRFDFDVASESGVAVSKRDSIRDFARSLDKIDLATIDANTTVAGDQAFKWIGFNSLSGKAGEIHGRYVAGQGIVLEADRNGNKVIDFSIEIVDRYAIAAVDFIL